jgi:hypothetical protein
MLSAATTPLTPAFALGSSRGSGEFFLCGPAPLPVPGPDFPVAFNIYSKPLSRKYVLGKHDSQPLYAFRTYSAISGQPAAVLHNIPDPREDREDMWATVEFPPLSSDVVISLPGVAGSSSQKETMEIGASSEGYSFSVEVGDARAGLTRESFGWRHTSSTGGLMVKLPEGMNQGWMLVRKEKQPLYGVNGHTFRAYGDGAYLTPDGYEVLAVCADVGSALSTKRARFQFLGTASGSMYGSRFDLMAVMTALAIFEKDRRSKKQKQKSR